MADGEKIPVLFDTDIGSDIDDAVALAYLLSQPRCELLGVTTVTGQPTVRAKLADAVCRAFGRTDVPTHSGAATPLLVPQKQTDVPQETVLARYPHRSEFAPNAAVDFLRQTIRSRPGEIVLLSVGALTNIGLLFAIDPQVPGLLRQYVMMGGLYFGRLPDYGPAEWNASGDPHATAIVFAAKPPDMHCVGLDVTTRCRLPADECRQRFSTGPLKIVGEMAEQWFKVGTQKPLPIVARASRPCQHRRDAGATPEKDDSFRVSTKLRPQITFHDPLAAACVFEPGLCTFQPGLVEIELRGDELLGMTRFDPGAADKPHHVAVDVKPEVFFDHYFETVS